MMKKNLYVDIHVIQTVPPSCVNRDDSGSPKTCTYGGVMRARVSSQAWKKATRTYFRDNYMGEDIGIRTRKVEKLVAEKIVKMDPGKSAEEAEALARTKLIELGVLSTSKDKKDDENASEDKGKDVLFFISDSQAEAVAKLLVDGVTNKKDNYKYKAALMEHPSFDIVLFGRMVAADPSLNYDAACQVAHAISTHEIENECDYFTAVDDYVKEDNAGAAHIGSREFNSSTLYRYATVNVRELARFEGEGTPSVLRAFVEAFALSMPSGMQNSFANRTLPAAIYVTIRNDQPVNLCGAFEKPVRGKNGYESESIDAMTRYAKEIHDNYGAPKAALIVGATCENAEKVPFDRLLDTLEEKVKECLQ